MRAVLVCLLLLAGCTVTIPKSRTIELPTRQYSQPEQVIQQHVIQDGKVRVLTCHWEEE